MTSTTSSTKARKFCASQGINGRVAVQWMSGVKPIADRNFAAVLRKAYHTGKSTGLQTWDASKGVMVARTLTFRPCTWKDCKEVETAERKFKFCTKCQTVYCSAECSRKDWVEGDHKLRCKAFQEQQAKEKAFYADCATCTANWGKRDFTCCHSCLFKSS